MSKIMRRIGFGLFVIATLIAFGLPNAYACKELKFVKFSSTSLHDIPSQIGSPIDLFLNFLELGGIRLGNQTVENRFREQAASLEQNIFDDLYGRNDGLLLEVRYFQDEFGKPLVPSSGSIVYHGVGLDVVDAYAESIRRPGLSSPRPARVSTDLSYFTWVTMDGEKICAGVQTPEMTKVSKSKAQDVARIREQLAQMEKLLPNNLGKRIDVASYWVDVWRTNQTFLKQSNTEQNFSDFLKRLGVAQSNFNEAYAKYQSIQSEFIRRQNDKSLFEKIVPIVDFLASAAEAGSLLSSDGEKIGKSETIASTRPDENLKEIEALKKAKVELRNQTEVKFKILTNENENGKKLFNKLKRTLPKQHSIPGPDFN